MSLSQLLQYVAISENNLVEKLFDFLRIPSISTDKSYFKACKDAGKWVANQLNHIGFKAKIIQTDGNPIVIAEAGEGAPHLLFYGHYDVQPIDPLNEWENSPFDPVVKPGKNGKMICARGASDDKGQLLTFLNACEAFFSIYGKLPCKVTILIEGEEESGSPSLLPIIRTYKKYLQADHAIICDTGMWNFETPAISVALRGMLAEEITLSSANKDLHSGMYGGPAINPLRELAKLLSSLHDASGYVKIKDFYKDVIETPPTLRHSIQRLEYSNDKFLQDVGLSTPVGEKNFSVLEQLWTRPTCEINGIWGGYTGDGFKTVIPAHAHAKISFRLVKNQDPNAIKYAFRNHMNSLLHPDCSLSFLSRDEGTKAVNIPTSTPIFKAAAKALKDEWGIAPVYVGCGGSIPIVSLLKDTLDINSLLIGFALDDDKIHSPNEKYNLNSYIKGSKSWIRILHELTQ